VVRIIDLQGARVDFFLGEASSRSWWNYFFVAAGVKLPLLELLLALTGFVLLVRDRSVRRLCVLWLPPALLLLLGATQVLNIGFRHMLPAIPFLLLLAPAWPNARPGSRRVRCALRSLLVCWCSGSYSTSHALRRTTSPISTNWLGRGRTGAISSSIPTWTGARI
jgi:hypothetical protein